LQLEPGLALYRHKRATRLGDSQQERSTDDRLSRAERRRLRRGWAELIRRVYEADPLLCECGAQMRVLSFITDPAVVTKLLEHLRRRSREPSRAPPSSTEVAAALAS
jgi:hypothetical protein